MGKTDKIALTPEQERWLVAHFRHTKNDDIMERLGISHSTLHRKARELGLTKTRQFMRKVQREAADNPKAVAHRFTKGHHPSNKGKRMPPEVYAKVARTMFKKGNTPHNHREVGSERVNVDGYIEIKVAEPNRWRLKHRVVWERVNGAIPRGHNVQFRNHNPLDCRIENLYLISREDQMAKENSFYAKYPKDLQEVIHLKGVVNRAIHKAQRNGRQ